MLCVALAAYVVAFAGTYWLSVRTVTGREFADAALRGALLTHSAVADTVDRVLDIVSVASLMGALAVVATIALVRLARVTGLAALGLMLGSNATTWLLKEQLLTRPDLGVDEYTAAANSLPSGHTTAVFSAVAAVLLVVPARLRPLLAVTGGAFTFLTAMATMSAGWHRAGDSVGAFLVVGAWTTTAAIAVVLVADTGQEPHEPPGPATRWFGVLALGALILGFTLVLALDATAGFRDSAVGQTVSLVVGAALVAAALTLVLLLTLRVLDLMQGEAADRTAGAPGIA